MYVCMHVCIICMYGRYLKNLELLCSYIYLLCRFFPDKGCHHGTAALVYIHSHLLPLVERCHQGGRVRRRGGGGGWNGGYCLRRCGDIGVAVFNCPLLLFAVIQSIHTLTYAIHIHKYMQTTTPHINIYILYVHIQ